MDLSSLVALYNTLPEPARQACGKVAASAGAWLAGEAWSKLRPKDPLGAAFARVYQQWREGLLEEQVEDKTAADAFGEFFCRRPVLEELDKLRRDRYQEIDFNVLAEQLRESCQYYKCPLPDVDLFQQLEGWFEDLEALLQELPEYQQAFRPSIQTALRHLRRPEGGLRNYSLARHAYLRECVEQHRWIRFRGTAEVRGPSEVEMARVFVLPRVAAEGEMRAQQEANTMPAGRLLTHEAKPRVVVLGKPGSGKTTLLEYFALALANREAPEFAWTAGLPPWLPVFYRVRHLDSDWNSHPGADIFGCLHAHCSERLGLNLPAGFFRRQMATGELLVLFDGLDEVASEARRIDLVDRIGAFNRNLSRASRVVISSRPYEYARSRFTAEGYGHFELCEFSDEEIREFIGGWYRLRQPDRAAAEEQAAGLWRALESRRKIQQLARNALLLTMIVRVHSGMSALPNGRLDLFAKCADTLLEHWAVPAGQGEGPLEPEQKRRFLARLAFELQSRATPEQLSDEGCLQLSRAELGRRLEKFLVDSRGREHAPLAEVVVKRLHSRDAILVNYGGDQFGFVHRSFQEYFAACRIADKHSDFKAFRNLLLKKRWIERPGWNETLYLAFAQLSRTTQARMLLELLQESRVEFALECLNTGAEQDQWLRRLVQFLSKYSWAGQEHSALEAAECADLCRGLKETKAVLRSLFDPKRREGRALPAAVELAEQLPEGGELLHGFFSESAQCGLDTTDRMALVEGGAFPYGKEGAPVELPAFYLDRYLVTNHDYECMIPGRRRERDGYSDADDQPVIYVNWYEARLYCRWRGPGFHLPTEQEWEKAASWDPVKSEKRVYPWGKEFDSSKCNTSEGKRGKTSSVGDYPGGVSPHGCHDMAGNVWEWTASPWEEGSEYTVIRGGAWGSGRDIAACACRSGEHPQSRSSYVGFRCARTFA